MIHYIIGGYLIITLSVWAILWKVTGCQEEGAFLFLPAILWPVLAVIAIVDVVIDWLNGG